MSYTGLIAELPMGIEGLTGTKNLAKVRPTQLLQALNISYEDGTLRKEGGATKYNATAVTGAPRVVGGWDWWPTDTVQRMIVVTSDGKILKDSGAGTFPVTLKTALAITTVTVPIFVEGGIEQSGRNRKLFIFTGGGNPIQVLSADGGSTLDLATPPADWAGANQPTFGLLHEGRLWGCGNDNDPSRFYYSQAGNHETMTGAGSGSLSIYPGEGERLIGGISFRGLLIALKRPRGIYMIDTSNSDITLWRARRLTTSAGMPGGRAFCLTDNDAIFLDQGGNFQLLSAVKEFGDVSNSNLSDLSDMGPFIRDNLNLGQLAVARAVYYRLKREAHFAVAGIGATKNSRRIVVDLAIPNLPRFRWSDRDVCEDLWLRKDINNVPRLISGDDVGFVRTMDGVTRSKDGVGYNGQFQTAHNDLSHIDPKLGTVRKQGDFLEIVVEPKGNWNLSVDILWDGTLRQTLNFNMGVSGAALDSFVLDTDRLAGDQVLNKKKRITGGGRRISIVGRNSGAGEDFSVAKAYLHFRPGDERL